jgi:octanoyl-[GcvH]:protein N-octanoyltransferase
MVSAGELPETLRLHRPSAIVAFGPKDRLAKGFAHAVGTAAGQGFASVFRLAGGSAAVFHERTIAFSWAVPAEDPRLGITERFEEVAAIVAAAVRSLGVDARVGEVPGEYCPGAHSVNARGRRKVMGVGQRIVRRAAHVGGVIVVGDGARVRDVLVPVYDHLGLTWDPETAGSLEDEVPGVTWESVEDALITAFADRFDLEPVAVPPRVLELARTLQPEHEIGAPAAAPA